MKKLYLALIFSIVLVSPVLGQIWTMGTSDEIVFDAILSYDKAVCVVDSNYGSVKKIGVIQNGVAHWKQFTTNDGTYMFDSMVRVSDQYFCIAYYDTLYKFDYDLNVIEKVNISISSQPTKMSESPEHLFITGVLSDQILVYDKENLQLIKTITIAGGMAAIGEIVYRDNFLYISRKQQYDANSVSKYDMDGTLVWRYDVSATVYIDQNEDGILFAIWNGNFGMLSFNGSLVWSDSLAGFSITDIKATSAYSFSMTGSQNRLSSAVIFEKDGDGYKKVWEKTSQNIGQYLGAEKSYGYLLIFGNEQGNGVLTMFKDPCVGVEETFAPISLSLCQNYPNPFNPSTTISFSVPTKEYVTLKVYDALGKEVAILFNEELATGTYEKNFDASNLSSGVYFYTVQAGSFIASKKMLLLK